MFILLKFSVKSWHRKKFVKDTQKRQYFLYKNSYFYYVFTGTRQKRQYFLCKNFLSPSSTDYIHAETHFIYVYNTIRWSSIFFFVLLTECLGILLVSYLYTSTIIYLQFLFLHLSQHNLHTLLLNYLVSSSIFNL